MRWSAAATVWCSTMAAQCADTRMGISALVLDGEIDKARAAIMEVVERISAAGPPELR